MPVSLYFSSLAESSNSAGLTSARVFSPNTQDPPARVIFYYFIFLKWIHDSLSSVQLHMGPTWTFSKRALPSLAA